MNHPSESEKQELQLCRRQPIPSWTLQWRKLRPFSTVLWYRSYRYPKFFPVAPEKIARKISETHAQAERSASFRQKTLALWKIEILGFVLARVAHPEASVCNLPIPRQAKPVAHVGFGAGTVERGGFDQERIVELIGELADPEYGAFGMEPLGAALSAFHVRWPWADRVLFRLLRFKWSTPEDFMQDFSAEERRLISHGYGRLLYFQCFGLRRAIAAAQKHSFLDVSGSIQGVAFAYAMVNYRDIDRVMQTLDCFQESELKESFRRGLIYALVFWEWFSPGTLDAIPLQAKDHESMIRLAQSQARSSLEKGVLPAFRI